MEERSPTVVKEFELCQNYPNPFNPSTKINYSLAKSELVTLTIYSITGQKVRTLVNEVKNAGAHSVLWGGFNDEGQLMSSGVYLYILKSESAVDTKKMIFIK